ncbi:MAG: glycoside hydrolase family 73 protein [Candidatus Sericytochromatia bacterium]
MSQYSSLPPLMSPQQLLQARQQPAPFPMAPAPLPTTPARPVSALPPLSAPSAPKPRFNSVSSLLTPDQLQIYRPQGPAQMPLLSGMATPGNLFRRPGVSPAAPALGMGDLRFRSALERLKQMPPAELKRLGENDPKAFFAALLPAAIESEKQFGVPAEVTLAQAALESGWARSPIGGYNIFGIKGSGPAGKTSVNTKEFLDGRWVTIRDGFAKYNNFYEAVKEHGELFHNGYYDKAVNQYAKDRNTNRFIDNIQGIYATDPGYSRKIKSLIADHGLDQMVNSMGMV